MAASYQLVPMNMELIPQIAELERQCFSKPWTEAMLAEELDNLTASFIAVSYTHLDVYKRQGSRLPPKATTILP